MNTPGNHKEKIIIYQVLPRLAGNTVQTLKPWGTISENGSGKFNHLNAQFLEQIAKLGANHIWLTGVIEHASCTGYPEHGISAGNPLVIKGCAGSPYAITDYYDVCPDLATDVDRRMEEFEALINRCHAAGLGPVIDFVPNHVARQYSSNQPKGKLMELGIDDDSSKAFDPKNNFYYLPAEALDLPGEVYQLPTAKHAGTATYYEKPAKATGNDCFSSKPAFTDWYETVKLNYGVDVLNNRTEHFDPVPNTWYKMLDILLFWAKKQIAGFRCDMAEMVPLPFWQWAIQKVREQHPNIIFIAEIYTPHLYRPFVDAGFNYLYDKVGLYDTIREVLAERQPASAISNVWKQLNGLDAHMLRFMENHDEQRIASGHFTGNALAGIPSMTVSACLHRGPAMIYFGQELGEKAAGETGFSGDDGRTSIFDYCHIPTFQRWFNEGKCNEKHLTSDEKHLRKFYQKLFELCRHPVISQGEFYDLMWANDISEQPSVYSFLRWDKSNTWLIIANFSNRHTVRTNIRIPGHFWELAGYYDTGSLFNLTGLLSTGFEKTLFLSELIDPGMEVELPPYSAEVVKLSGR